MVVVETVVADAADRAADGVLSLPQVSERLVEQMRDLEPASYSRDHVDALRAAVCFEGTPDGTFRGSFAGDSAAPWPRELEEIPVDALALWHAYADHVRDPALRAHLRDLLQQAGYPPVHVQARAAISAYREAAGAFLGSAEQNRGRLRAVKTLARALSIAVARNQPDLRTLVVGDILAMASDLLTADPVPFGLVLELLEALQPRRLEPGKVRGLIEQAVSACPEIIMQVRFLNVLRAMESGPAAQKEIDRRIVTAMTVHADQASGALRLSWLNDAATAARDAGLTDMYRDLTLTMQGIQVADLGLVPTGRIVVQVSQEEMDDALAVIDQVADLADALWRTVSTQPPAGTLAAAQRQARLLIPTAPLASFVARGALNAAGPVPVAPASNDALANVQADCQLYELHKSGLIVAAQLDRVGERFSPGEDDLAALFACPASGSVSKVRMLAHAFQFYWAGLDDAAVHLALPRVESLLREIVRGRGVPVLAVARGTKPAGVSQLGTLIDVMPDAGFDPDWQRSLALLLTDGERGLNLRNDISHGLRDCPSRPLIALVLQAALFLLAVAHGVIPLTGCPASDPQE